MQWRRVIAGSACAIAIAAGYATGLWALDRWAIGVAHDAYSNWRTICMNAAVTLPLLLVLAAATRKMLLPVLLVGGAQVLIYQASALKLAILGSPVTLQDANFLIGMNSAVLHLLGAYVPHPWMLASGIAGAILVVASLAKFEPSWCARLGPGRLASAILGLLLATTMVLAAWPWSKVYNESRVRPSLMSLTPAVLHGGLMSSLLYRHMALANTVYRIDTAALQAAMDRVGGTSVPDPRAAADRAAPDVVVVLSESFMDPRIIQGMDRVADPIPHVRVQLEAGNGGYMLAPTFGGGTVRTEFEVLTGMPVDAFPTVLYPYVDLGRAQMPGVARVLRKRGYDTVAIHGNSGAFWNRTNTYRTMGIDRFLTARDFRQRGADRDGVWYSDASMTDIILEQLAPPGRPRFVLAISIEEHGPYNTDVEVDDPRAWNAIQLPPGLDAAAAHDMRNYLYHLRNADRQFDRLLRALRARGRPFVLLFFGDHLPALGDAYAPGFRNGQSPRDQLVPWVLVSSDGAKPASATRPRFAWELPFELLSVAGADTPYLRFVGLVGQRLDATNASRNDPVLVQGLHAAAVARLNNRFKEYSR